MTEYVCEDKISYLPNDLLVQILLLIPTKDAVATMILSKRWRLVWTMIPKLEYKDIINTKSVWWFFHKSLQLHKAPVIESLCIELGSACPIDVDVGEWVEKVVDRFVRKLEFKLGWSENPTSLPESLYTCETLVELKLSDKILIDFPSSGCLSSLKKLCLSNVVYKDEDSLIRLLSSCSVLEKLLVKREDDDNVTEFCVTSPSLLFLSYDGHIFDHVGNTARFLYIDTPALKHLILSSCRDEFCILKNMPCLDSADICYVTFYNDFPRFFSSVSSLDLCYADETLLRCSTIFFSRLEKLCICPHESDWLEPLMVILGNSPKLKHLFVDCGYIEEPKDLPLSWNQPSSVPTCLSSHLVIFEWTEEYGGRVEEKEFVTYILANSKCLKRATIILSYSFNLEDKQKMEEELESIPRVSKASQLLFE